MLIDVLILYVGGGLLAGEGIQNAVIAGAVGRIRRGTLARNQPVSETKAIFGVDVTSHHVPALHFIHGCARTVAAPRRP